MIDWGFLWTPASKCSDQKSVDWKPAKLTAQELSTAGHQASELKAGNETTCGNSGCVNTLTAIKGYKCFYCNIYFCSTCAESHFGAKE